MGIPLPPHPPPNKVKHKIILKKQKKRKTNKKHETKNNITLWRYTEQNKDVYVNLKLCHWCDDLNFE
jgi:hypothetical protein